MSLGRFFLAVNPFSVFNVLVLVILYFAVKWPYIDDSDVFKEHRGLGWLLFFGIYASIQYFIFWPAVCLLFENIYVPILGALMLAGCNN